MNKEYQEENNSCCYFHPKETIVGICALCLRERLLNLVLKQGHAPFSKDSNKAFRVLKKRPTISLPKLFTFRFFLGPHDQSQRGNEHCVISDKESIASPEDSFISIKFEENGEASWESKKLKAAVDHSPNNNTKNGKAIIETVHRKGMLKWRKRIGQVLKMTRLNRSSKANAGTAAALSNLEGSKGWIIRSLTRRRSSKKY